MGMCKTIIKFLKKMMSVRVAESVVYFCACRLTTASAAVVGEININGKRRRH
jgi:hypothetical protein